MTDAPFEEPWQIRVFALGRALVAQGRINEQDLQRALADAIEDDADRPYWESYLLAVERLYANVRS